MSRLMLLIAFIGIEYEGAYEYASQSISLYFRRKYLMEKRMIGIHNDSYTTRSLS